MLGVVYLKEALKSGYTYPKPIRPKVVPPLDVLSAVAPTPNNVISCTIAFL